MYSTALLLHSWLRWAILILGLIAVARAIAGRNGGSWTSTDEAIGKWFVLTLDIQTLIGLILYAFLSPITQAAFADFGGAMRNAGLRFWAVEHVIGMIVAVALVHVGRVKIRKAADPADKQRTAALFFGLAFIILLASIPWPGMPAGRPFIRGF